MVQQLLLVMLCFAGVMFSGPALVAGAVFLFKLDLGRIAAEHRLTCSIAAGLYGALVALAFFALQDRFIVFRPEPGTTPLGRSELMGLVEQAFTRPVEGKPLFEVTRDGDRLLVTWSAGLDFFQGISAGGRRMKRVVALTLEEDSHRAFFLMHDRDAKWSASLSRAEFSLNYVTGISAEFRSEAYPSISYSPQEGLKVELKRLSYNSEELWQPLSAAVLGAGWSLHGGMAPKLRHRLLFALPVGLLFFGVIFFAATLAAAERSPAKAGVQAAPQEQAVPVSTADLEAQLAQVLPTMSTAAIGAQLEGVLAVPPQQLHEYTRRCFGIYLRAYLRRADRQEDLARRATEHAARLGPEDAGAPAGKP